MTTVIFVRHGQSESNLNRIFTGQNNTLLTELGHEQAKRTALFLKDYPISQIYASDLTRAMQTAAPTAELHGLTVQPNPRLREIFAGDWEGLSYEALKETYKESYNRWITDIGRAAPENGERVSELYARVTEEVARLVEKHHGETIAIFSHATPSRAMGCFWYGVAPEEMASVKWVTNASVSIAEYHDNGEIRVVLYSYDEHQGDATTALPKGSA